MPTFPSTLYRTPADWGDATYATDERVREMYGELCLTWGVPDEPDESANGDPIDDCTEFTLESIDGDLATYSRSIGRGKYETVTLRADQFGDFTEV